MSKLKKNLVVAAIDFGTSYSGYAFAFKAEPEKIYSNNGWNTEVNNAYSLKTPTVILFNEDGEFDSFGFEAESKYAELAEEEDHVGWRLFKNFKMELNTSISQRKLRRKFRLRDDQGNTMLALKVFTDAIRYLKDHIMSRLESAVVGSITHKDVNWVLTVPAIWQDGAKQFMKEAAEQAGIPRDQLILALEPEAAALYCKTNTIVLATEHHQEPNLESFKTGAQFMVLDLGGGTVDITAHQVEPDGRLKELYPPSGGPWGGTFVDKAFQNIFYELFDEETLVRFGKQSKSDEIILYRTLDLMKRDNLVKTPYKDTDKVTVKIPEELVKAFGDRETFVERLKASRHAENISMVKDKFRIKVKMLVELFQKSKDEIIKHVGSLLKEDELQHVNHILLVGGFSESNLMLSAIKEAFSHLDVIRPMEAGLAVVKGAVLYGHDIHSISSRKIPYSYGIGTTVPFIEGVHPPKYRYFDAIAGEYKCGDVLKLFIKAGSTVIPGETAIEHTFNGTVDSSIEIYKAKENESHYTGDDGCQKIGEIVLDLETAQQVIVTLCFGSTELEVKAKMQKSKDPVGARYNFLN